MRCIAHCWTNSLPLCSSCGRMRFLCTRGWSAIKKTFWKYKHISVSVKCKNCIHYNRWPYESANQPIHSGRRGITDHGWNRLSSGLVTLAYCFAHILCLCFLCVKIYNHIIWHLYLDYSAKENMRKKLPSKEQEREEERGLEWSSGVHSTVNVMQEEHKRHRH